MRHDPTIPTAMARGALAALLAVSICTAAAEGQRRPAQQPAPAERIDCPPSARSERPAQGQPIAAAQGYDVVLHVPRLCVRRLRLGVEDLQAKVALDARVANLIRVNVGADVHIEEVDLAIDGVRAEALLLIDLENVVFIVNRTLDFVDQNPEIVRQLAGTVQHTARTVGRVADTALQPGGVVDRAMDVAGETVTGLVEPGGVLSRTVNTLGQTVEATLDQTGNLVERTLDARGSVLGSRTLGALTDLPVLGETRNTAGQVVRTARLASGGVIEYTMDAAGRVLNARMLDRTR